MNLRFIQEREKGTPLSGQNEKVSCKHSFKEQCFIIASNGWSDRWKKGHRIQLSTGGESLSSYQTEADYKIQFKHLLSTLKKLKTSMRQTGLNFKILLHLKF